MMTRPPRSSGDLKPDQGAGSGTQHSSTRDDGDTTHADAAPESLTHIESGAASKESAGQAVPRGAPAGLPSIKTTTTPPLVISPLNTPRNDEGGDGAGQGPSEGKAAARALAAAAQQQHLEDARTARLASLAEQADLAGLEKALDAMPSHRMDSMQAGVSTLLTPPLPSSGRTRLDVDEELISLQGPSPALSATPASLGNEAFSEQQGRGGGARERGGLSNGRRTSSLHRVDTPPDPRRALMRELRRCLNSQIL